MNRFRFFAFAAVMAASLPGMAQQGGRKVCVVTGELNGYPASVVKILRIGEDAFRYYGDTIPVRDGCFRYELEADGNTVYTIFASKGGSGIGADFFAEEGAVHIKFHPDSVADVITSTPLNTEMRRVKAATDTISKNAFGRRDALERAGRDYTEPARRLLELRQCTKDRDSIKAIEAEMRLMLDEGKVFTPEFEAAEKAVGEAFRREYKARCRYAVEHPGPVGLYFLQDAAASGLADTALVRRAVEEIYAKRYPAAYATRWLQGWLAGCNTRVGGRYFDFTAPDLGGAGHTLSVEIEGKVALIDLWASWCGSCRSHSMALIPVYEKYKERGFTVVGVAREFRDSRAMKKAIERDGYPWLNLLELDDRLGIWTKYGVGNAGGARFLVGRDGRILAINPDAAQVEAILEKEL